MTTEEWVADASDPWIRQARTEIVALVRRAIAEEREACVATLDAMAKRGENPEIRAAYSLGAAAIRARNEPA